MGAITAQMVKVLRSRTGAGLMDCKKALAESGGEIEAAVDWLRRKGHAAAANRAGRAAGEGLIALAVEGSAGALVELNSETDFVARNEVFAEAAAEIARAALRVEGLESLRAAAMPGAAATVGECVGDLAARLGENIVLRRTAKLECGGLVAAYVHNRVREGCEAGRIGALAALESEGRPEALAACGRLLAMHIASARPLAVRREDISPDLVAREREIHAGQAALSGKPEAVAAKITAGRMEKFYRENALLEQAWIMDDKKTVGGILEEEGRKIGAPVKIAGLACFALGEAAN